MAGRRRERMLGFWERRGKRRREKKAFCRRGIGALGKKEKKAWELLGKKPFLLCSSSSLLPQLSLVKPQDIAIAIIIIDIDNG